MAAADSHQPEAIVRIAADLDMIASEAATQTFGVLGAKGSGKSYTARRLAEQLLRAGVQTIIIEPIGNWWSLRLAADGVSPGVPIAVIGGMHADLPLDLARGEELAVALISSGASAVIDVSEFSKSQRKTFVAAFIERVFREARLNPAPRMVIFEEAQVFAPQHKQPGEERMLGAVTDLVRLGRNYGLGSTLITQRPQSVNKEVLNQAEVLLVGQLRGPHERKAIEGWATDTGADEGVSNADLKALPTLAVGEFFLWSPSWLRVFRRVRILPTETYDGSSTPTLGAARSLKERAYAPVDLDALRAALTPPPPPEEASTSELLPKRKRGEDADAFIKRLTAHAVGLDRKCHENAIAFDELRQKLPEFDEETRAAGADFARKAWIERETELLEEIQLLRRRLQIAAEGMRSKAEVFAAWARALDKESEPSAPRPKLSDPCPIEGRYGRHETYVYLDQGNGAGAVECIRCGARGPWATEPGDAEVPAATRQTEMELRGPRRAEPRAKPIVVGNVDVNTAADAYQADLLGVIAQHGPLDVKSIAFLSGKSHASSTFKGAMRALRAAGLISERSPFVTTDAGAKQAKATPLPRGKALLDYWLSRLPEYERLILGSFVDGGRLKSTGRMRPAIAEAIERSSGSSSFKQAVRTLIRFGILEEDDNRDLRVTKQFREAVSS